MFVRRPLTMLFGTFMLYSIILYYTSGRRPDLFETHQSILKAVALE